MIILVSWLRLRLHILGLGLSVGYISFFYLVQYQLGAFVLDKETQNVVQLGQSLTLKFVYTPPPTNPPQNVAPLPGNIGIPQNEQYCIKI